MFLLFFKSSISHNSCLTTILRRYIAVCFVACGCWGRGTQKKRKRTWCYGHIHWKRLHGWDWHPMHSCTAHAHSVGAQHIPLTVWCAGKSQVPLQLSFTFLNLSPNFLTCLLCWHIGPLNLPCFPAIPGLCFCCSLLLEQPSPTHIPLSKPSIAYTIPLRFLLSLNIYGPYFISQLWIVLFCTA